VTAPRVLLEAGGRRYALGPGREIAIPLDFHGLQARAFGLPRATSEAFETDGFVGDTRRGGAANCETLTITPHGNGTHTESIGHITERRVPVADCVAAPLLAATLITVRLRPLSESSDTYAGTADPDDLVITAAAIEQALARVHVPEGFHDALVLRIPTDDGLYAGPAQDHTGHNPPYLTDQAARALRDLSCDHLLLELPSVDRESDGGGLTSHHTFFGDQERRTITEMVAVPRDLPDGPYALSLRFARLLTDAAPSRPILYPLEVV
jgi:arylformamidase